MKQLITIIAFLFVGILNLNGQEVSKNKLGLEFGYGGGDGIIFSNIYGIHYIRSFNSRFDGYLKYNFSKGKDEFYSYKDKFILDDHEYDNAYSRFVQFYSFGMGLSTTIANTPNSSMYINLGSRYIRSNRSMVIGTNTKGGESASTITETTNERRTLFGFEFGVGYKKIIAQDYFIGGELGFLTAESRITASLIIGTHF